MRHWTATKGEKVPLAQRFAQVFGIIYLLVGILGFIPVAPFLVGNIPAVIGPFDGFLLGIFAVNWLHNLAHIAIGAAGLASYRSLSGARSYCLAIGVIYLILFLLGLIAPTVGGLIPLNPADNILHLLTGGLALGAYFASPQRAIDPRGPRL